MGTKITFVGSFLLSGRGSGLFSRQFFRKFNLPKTVRTETKVCSAKYTERKQTTSLKHKCYLRMVLATESSLSPSGEDGLALVRSGAGWSLRSAVAFSGLDLPIRSNRSDRYCTSSPYAGLLLVLWNEKYLFHGVDNLIHSKVGKREY